MITITELPVLYKYTSSGKVQQWQIFAEDNSFYTEEGLKGGKITRSKPTITEGKNVGRSNESTPEEQAILEATAKWQKKINEGYNEVLTKGEKYFKPMLAREIKDAEKILFTKRTFIQPKLDGLRCISENNTLMSRNGKPYITCPHLCQDLAILDGELYNHSFKDDFNEIVSIIKRTKVKDDDLKKAKEFAQHWVYDYPGYEGVFSQRYEALKYFLSENPIEGVKIVPTYEVFSLDDIEKYHEEFLAEGFEGSIIRIDLAHYEKDKRAKQLLKKKDWMDAEFEIVGYEEGEGGRTGTIGKFWVRLDRTKPYSIKDEENVCKSNVKGNFDYLAEVLKDADSYIGTDATIKFFGYTPDGALRFPYVIKLNRQSYE